MSRADTTKWYAAEVKRPDGGNLYSAVRWVDGHRIEADITPTHSRDLAEKMADALNQKEQTK